MVDWIQGEKFVGVADMVFSPKNERDCNPLVNTFSVKGLKATNIIYTHTMYVQQLFRMIKGVRGRFIVVSHNCDENVDDSYIIPSNVCRWYTQNAGVAHPKIIALPIGLENDRWFRNIDKKGKMLEKMREEKRFRNTAYLNVNVNTFPTERTEVYERFVRKPWVTAEKGINGKDFDNYLDSIHNHRYVICPRGNGLDTHRLWETLYMGSIPVVRKDSHNWQFSDLPILYVNEWEELNVGLLDAMWPIYRTGEWEREKLTFTYWKNKILSHVSN
jgi:hypothetical protein